MRIVVTGATGMLGTDVCERLSRDHDVVPAGRETLDVTSLPDAAAALRGADAVVNCAAWTSVDDAEQHEAEAFAVNAVGPHVLATAARAQGARLVQISTDYVFDGAGDRPYGEDDPVRPASAYGRTKAAGEWAAAAADALVVRTAWLYGAHGGCFPRTIARLARERDRLTVVDDQVGQPTWTVDVARVVADLLDARAPAGKYHATSSGRASWWEFARAVVTADGGNAERVAPVSSAEFSRPAPRPANSALGHDRLRAVGVVPIADWRERWAEAASTVLR